MQQEREERFAQIQTLQVENELLNETNQELKEQNQQLTKHNQELEEENRQLQQHNQVLNEQHRQLQEDNQGLQQQLDNVVLPFIPDYQALRDRILKNWRVAKAPEKKERIKESLDRFIEAITESTPGEDHD